MTIYHYVAKFLVNISDIKIYEQFSDPLDKNCIKPQDKLYHPTYSMRTYAESNLATSPRMIFEFQPYERPIKGLFKAANQRY